MTNQIEIILFVCQCDLSILELPMRGLSQTITLNTLSIQ